MKSCMLNWNAVIDTRESPQAALENQPSVFRFDPVHSIPPEERHGDMI